MTKSYPAPSQWPFGVIVGVSIAIADVAAQASLGEFVLDGGELRFGALVTLVRAQEDTGAGPLHQAVLWGIGLALLALLALVRRKDEALALGLLLGGVLGKLLDLWDDGVAIDILRLGEGAASRSAAPAVSIADLALIGGSLVLLVCRLRHRRGGG